jgi:hypothetical protein
MAEYSNRPDFFAHLAHKMFGSFLERMPPLDFSPLPTIR